MSKGFEQYDTCQDRISWRMESLNIKTLETHRIDSIWHGFAQYVMSHRTLSRDREQQETRATPAKLQKIHDLPTCNFCQSLRLRTGKIVHNHVQSGPYQLSMGWGDFYSNNSSETHLFVAICKEPQLTPLKLS